MPRPLKDRGKGIEYRRRCAIAREISVALAGNPVATTLTAPMVESDTTLLVHDGHVYRVVLYRADRRPAATQAYAK